MARFARLREPQTGSADPKNRQKSPPKRVHPHHRGPQGHGSGIGHTNLIQT